MPLTPGDIIVTNISPTATFDMRGNAVRMTNVEFTVRGKGPFSRQMPTDGFDMETLLVDIRKFAEQIVKGLEFTG